MPIFSVLRTLGALMMGFAALGAAEAMASTGRAEARRERAIVEKMRGVEVEKKELGGRRKEASEVEVAKRGEEKKKTRQKISTFLLSPSSKALSKKESQLQRDTTARVSSPLVELHAA